VKAAARAVYELAVPRALALAQRLEIPLTFFAVSDDLQDHASCAALRLAIAEGHTVESHSASHPYDLAKLDPERLRREVTGSFNAIEGALGQRPRGFRAPGYALSDEVLDALEDAGAIFDASSFPCPAYYFAKLAALGAITQSGRRSASVIGPPRGVLAPTEPYLPGHPWWRAGGRSILEIPMRVTRGLRLPVIGTSVGLAGPRGARMLVRACGRPATFSLELHGLDFLDRDDGLHDLVGHQPELRRTREDRLAALESALTELRALGYGFLSMRELAVVTLAALTSPCT